MFTQHSSLFVVRVKNTMVRKASSVHGKPQAQRGTYQAPHALFKI